MFESVRERRGKRGTDRRSGRLPALATAFVILVALAPVGAGASGGPADGGHRGLGPGTRVAYHAGTGLVRSIGTSPGRPIPRPAGIAASTPPVTIARAFLDRYANAFGIADQASELRVTSSRRVSGGRSVVRFRQVHDGIPVLGGELIVHLDERGNLLSVGGEVLPRSDLAMTPRVRPADARRAARTAVAKSYGAAARSLTTSAPRLWIYDSRILGGPGLGVPTLVWRMDVTRAGARPIDELVLVDARLGSVALHFTQLEEAKDRQVCDADSTANEYPCATPVRSEGDLPSGNQDVDDAYDYSGDTYDFYFTNFGRDSLDNAGMTLYSTVRFCPNPLACPYQNAFWDGQQMVYGAGFAAADDVVGHELTHGVTEFTSHLFYYYQSGAINESFSDVFGEFVDLTNGAGTDTAATRWQMGEDIPGIGAIRDMQDPTSFGDPDRMLSPNYTADVKETDGGGVHSNSGVNNKAAYLMTDGDTFNGQAVTGLGIPKVASLYYLVQASYLTSASDYADLGTALHQACLDFVGVLFTAADCAEVADAVLAVEMAQSPTAAPNPEAPVCPAGQTATSPSPFTDPFFDDLENPGSGNWASQNPWYYPQNPNPILDATYATSGTTNFWGYDRSGSADYSIAMTASTAIPAGNTFLRFAHAHGFEDDPGSAYDGGVLEYSTTGGASWLDAGALPVVNGYNGTIASGSGNPLATRSAFVRESNGYISSRFDLSSLAGQNVRFRFRIGTDSTVDDYGWFVDDVRIYTCTPVGGPNDPPVADAGGPYAISEGDPLNLNGSGSTDPDGDPLTYGWELDGDADFDDASGQQPVVSWATLVALGIDDGPAGSTVELRVSDVQPLSDTDSVGLTLNNRAPTAGIGGPASVTPGQNATWTFSSTDQSPVDQAGAFSYQIDWDGNGTVDQTVNGDNSENVGHTYPGAGNPTIRATSTDKDGGVSVQATMSVSVSAGGGGGGGGGGGSGGPETTITSGPSGPTNDPTPQFAFSSSAPNATFHCRIDTSDFALCTTPHTTGTLSQGPHTFEVRAFDPDTLLLDGTPAIATFTVDSVAPEATITTHPGKRTKKQKATFSFDSNEAATFACQIDNGPWTACSSPFTTEKLSLGRHTFRVKAIDAVGNETPSPPSFRFRVVRRR